MKPFKIVILLITLATGLNGCFNANIPKPDNLIKRDKLGMMMVDV